MGCTSPLMLKEGAEVEEEVEEEAEEAGEGEG